MKHFGSVGAGSRTIARAVAPTIMNPAVSRLIGTVDVDGAGTLHPLADVDPFILLDMGKVTKKGMPSFGAHPHYGHSVTTILLGGKVRSWDSFHPEDYHVAQSPGTYFVDAGSGVFHDERAIIDNEDDPTQHLRMFQLWMGIKDVDRSRPPRVQINQAPLPTMECVDPQSGQVVGKATYHVGHGTDIETLYPISVVHIHQQAATTYRVPIVPTHGAFVVHMQGKASYGEGDGQMSSVDDTNTVLVLANTDDPKGADYLQVTTDDDTEYLVCSGERIQEPWVKKLVASGALIAKTADEARALATQVEEMAKKGKDPEGGSFSPFGI